MRTAFDVIVIVAGQSGPLLADRLVKSEVTVAVIERQHFGGTCVNTGWVPINALVSSAYVAHMARRAGEYGVDTGPVAVNLKRVKARKDAMVMK
jgi:pyruvate/2-oxoglutarate dehydrogenase complex dihydrolipoamide dehydrogenase (E3) component